MKTLKILGSMIILAGCLMIFACQKTDIAEPLDELALRPATEEEGLDQDLDQFMCRSREIPFKARFYTKRVPEKLGKVVCTLAEFQNPNYQRRTGHATHLGKFKTVLTFCSGADGFYGGGTGYLEAANGDRLFIKIPLGQVKLPLPEPHPVYDAYFQDEFEFCGGTGRFKGASGGGMTDSLVDLWDEDHPFPGPIIPNHRTDHKWTGTLILPKRRK